MSEKCILNPLLDLSRLLKDDDKIIATSVDNNGINILILHFLSKYVGKDGYFKEFYTKYTLKNYTYLRYDLKGKMLNKTFLKDEAFIFYDVNFLPSNEILLSCHECDKIGEFGLENNARIFNLNGKFLRDFCIGNEVSDVKIDLQGNIWVTYFDGIWYGSNCKDLPPNGLKCWSKYGKNIWSFKPTEGIEKIEECYAMTIDDKNNVWIYYFENFAVVKIDINKQMKCWYPDIEGSEFIQVLDDKILINDAYSQTCYDEYVLSCIKEDTFENIKYIKFITQDNFNLHYSQKIPCTSPHIGFLHENKIYLTNMKEVVKNG